jgi:hypothetical protein
MALSAYTIFKVSRDLTTDWIDAKVAASRNSLVLEFR